MPGWASGMLTKLFLEAKMDWQISDESAANLHGILVNLGHEYSFDEALEIGRDLLDFYSLLYPDLVEVKASPES